MPMTRLDSKMMQASHRHRQISLPSLCESHSKTQPRPRHTTTPPASVDPISLFQRRRQTTLHACRARKAWPTLIALFFDNGDKTGGSSSRLYYSGSSYDHFYDGTITGNQYRTNTQSASGRTSAAIVLKRAISEMNVRDPGFLARSYNFSSERY